MKGSGRSMNFDIIINVNAIISSRSMIRMLFFMM